MFRGAIYGSDLYRATEPSLSGCEKLDGGVISGRARQIAALVESLRLLQLAWTNRIGRWNVGRDGTGRERGWGKVFLL